MSDDRVRLDLGPAAQETLARLRAAGPFRYVAERDLLAMAVGYGLDHLAHLATLQENAPMVSAADFDPRTGQVTYSGPPPSPNTGLTEGRVVHYVLNQDSQNAGQHRPALVVRVWRTPETTTEASVPTGCVQLAVFVDGSNDLPAVMADPFRSEFMHPLWKTSVMHDEDAKKPGSWHWIERA